MNKVKTIAAFTSIRSEYGSLKSLLRSLQDDSDIDLHLLVGGAHLLDDYGKTKNEIIGDGFFAIHLFPFLFTDNEPDVLTRSVSVLAQQIGHYLSYNRPDLLIVIGDRFELLPVVNAALILNIPIAHISGGEITEGAIDNQVRNAVSKIANLHFVAAEEFKRNLIRMGEEEWRICICGELGLNEVLSMDFINKSHLYNDLGLDQERPVICATLHPETINNKITPDFVKELYIHITSNYNYQLLVTAANFDESGDKINAVLQVLAAENKNIIYVKSLGKTRYFSLLKYCDLVLGNSSSGLVEVQSFNKPVINIGKRQQGRLSNPNVLNVGVSVAEVITAITQVSSNEFKTQYYGKRNVYQKDGTVDLIVDFIKKHIEEDLLTKRSPV